MNQGSTKRYRGNRFFECVKSYIQRSAFFLFVIGMVCLFPTFVRADEGGYRILEYQVDAVLHEDNRVTQEETITVDFLEPRHGIYRMFPTYFKIYREGDTESRVYRYECSVKRVDVEGEVFETDYSEDDSSSYYIKIGDADTYVEGLHTYKIRFDYVMPEDRIKKGDFFFYSVLGADWKTDIENFSFRMEFEKPLPQSAVDAFQIYSGALGKTDNKLDITPIVDQNHVEGAVDYVAPRNAITLFTELPEDYFAGETAQSPIFVYALMSILFVAVIAGILKAVQARSKNAEVVETVEFYAPEGMNSAEVGYIYAGGAKLEQMTSLIPWFADQGYLELEEYPKSHGKSDLRIHKKKELDADAKEYERTFFNALIKYSGELESGGYSTKLGKAINTSLEQLKGYFSTPDKKVRTGYGRYWLFSILILVLAIATVSVSNAISFGYGAVYNVLLIPAYVIMFLFNIPEYKAKKKSATAKVVGNALSIGVILLAGWIATVMHNSDCFLPKALFVGVIILPLVYMWLAKYMIQITAYGANVYGKVLGLKRFIETAELPKLKMMIDENPSYFYNILPYAMALGLEERWADKFKAIEVEQPDWYYGNVAFYNVHMMSHMISHSMSNVIKDSVSHYDAELAKSSGGSGGSIGGGFSGGGGGGGGGGSW